MQFAGSKPMDRLHFAAGDHCDDEQEKMCDHAREGDAGWGGHRRSVTGNAGCCHGPARVEHEVTRKCDHVFRHLGISVRREEHSEADGGFDSVAPTSKQAFVVAQTYDEFRRLSAVLVCVALSFQLRTLNGPEDDHETHQSLSIVAHAKCRFPVLCARW